MLLPCVSNVYERYVSSVRQVSRERLVWAVFLKIQVVHVKNVVYPCVWYILFNTSFHRWFCKESYTWKKLRTLSGLLIHWTHICPVLVSISILELVQYFSALWSASRNPIYISSIVGRTRFIFSFFHCFQVRWRIIFLLSLLQISQLLFRSNEVWRNG